MGSPHEPHESHSSQEERLRAFVGRTLGPPRRAQDPVNLPMIRHWVEALGVDNPVHLDEDAARAAGRAGVVAPATMVQAWTMRGYAATQAPPPDDGSGALVAELAEQGYTSVVATDSEFEFHRELVPGDRVEVEERVERISPEKATALGPGRFVTTVRTYRDAHGQAVATQRWRTLRFRPRQPDPEPPALRPRPAVNRDNAFWFEAAREHRLVIQRCVSCGELRHPPGPCCPHCRSFEWDTVQASGDAHVHTFTVVHHPRHPAFDLPHIVAVVDLAEGTRLITDLVGTAPEHVRVGMPVRLRWLEADPDLTLPVFAPHEQEDP
ncbi:MaoC family dehydratase N-terminal domain-containing protein [Nocardiopsis sp. HNM0947]|uniref:MaoC family dehydratase N-terminal domain-containing protein n=1 Tax=Nocardiopsis coralli TaxID=2772213 RepID=A0ABR9PEY6_9ACTN|nr:bifunctional MaoC family dehydratase N-terminal/OB-fold nucleic acid binding domain-containing protein [Nocardiopsis coralli]MBE3002388.1 MaoC family dehydratase N-terminal domain-containing protein [Nocardiopsis coralli]